MNTQPTMLGVDGREIAEAPQKKSLPASLEKYKFQKGHAKLPGAGRPKGSRDSINVLLDAAPRLAKSYIQAGVKDRSPAILTDARRWIMPIESDAPLTEINLLGWLEQQANHLNNHQTSPPQLPSSSEIFPTLAPPPVVVEGSPEEPAGASPSLRSLTD